MEGHFYDLQETLHGSSGYRMSALGQYNCLPRTLFYLKASSPDDRKDHWGGYGRVHIQNVSLSNFVLELHKEEAFLFVQYIVGKGQLQPEQTSCKPSLGPPGPVRSRKDLSPATPKPNLQKWEWIILSFQPWCCLFNSFMTCGFKILTNIWRKQCRL